MAQKALGHARMACLALVHGVDEAGAADGWLLAGMHVDAAAVGSQVGYMATAWEASVLVAEGLWQAALLWQIALASAMLQAQAVPCH